MVDRLRTGVTVPASSLRRNPMSGLTVNVIGRKRPPEAESVTAGLATRSLQFLRELDPVFDVDFYQTVGDPLPDGAGVEQALGYEYPPDPRTPDAKIDRSRIGRGQALPPRHRRCVPALASTTDNPVFRCRRRQSRYQFRGHLRVWRIRMYLCRRNTDFAVAEARPRANRHLGLTHHRALPPNRIIASAQRTG